MIIQGALAMLNDYRIERITKERLVDLLGLFESAFNQKKTISYLKKKFDTERFGASFIGYIAYSQNEEPVAYYGVFPIRFKLNNRVILAAQSGDTMTHKNHQRKGLFTELAKMTYDLARKKGIKFIFGFPGRNSLPGFVKKLNWKIDGKRHFYRFNVCTLPLAALMHMVGMEKLYILYFNFWAKVFGLKKELGNIVIDRNNSIFYDSDGMGYRHFSDNYFLQNNGCVVWLKVVRSMEIGCIYNADDHIIEQIIKRLRWLSVITGLAKIHYWCSDNHPNLKFIRSYFKEYNASYYGHIALAEDTPEVSSFLYEACDADTY